MPGANSTIYGGSCFNMIYRNGYHKCLKLTEILDVFGLKKNYISKNKQKQLFFKQLAVSNAKDKLN